MAAGQPITDVVTFKTIPGFPGWMVGDDGRLLRLDGDSWREVSPRPNKNGYLTVVLSSGKVRRYAFMHTLVLEAFVGPRPPGMEACHAPDPDPANNRIGNLRWGTPRDNRSDLKRFGMNPRRHRKRPVPIPPARTPSDWPRRDLRPRDLWEIREQSIVGLTPEAIASIHQIPVAQAREVIRDGYPGVSVESPVPSS